KSPGRKRRIDHHHERRAANVGDRRDIAQEIETQVVIEGAIGHVRGRYVEQRVAVRRRTHHQLGGDIGCGAGSILNNERLADALRETAGNAAAAAARCRKRRRGNVMTMSSTSLAALQAGTAPQTHVDLFSNCSPAGGTIAAFNWRNVGTSRWQL